MTNTFARTQTENHSPFSFLIYFILLFLYEFGPKYKYLLFIDSLEEHYEYIEMLAL